jgi:anti-anti-sigma factor
MPQPFQVRGFTRGETYYVVPMGELDVGSAPKLREYITGVLESGQQTSLVVDLRELEFIDSHGLRLVLEIQSQCRDALWGFELVQGREAVRRLFEIVDLLDALPFRDGDGHVSACGVADPDC